MTQNLADWLESEGFGVYQSVFKEHEIDFDILSDLTESDLAEMGMPIGARKRMIRAIETYLGIKKTDPPKSEASEVSQDLTAIDSSKTAENRHMSIMFCDLVGSTALSETLDAEDLREIISMFRDTCAQVIKKYDGYLANYLGDGILIYFGYPTARENDAERAVRAGMEMISAVDELEVPGSIELKIRLGVATGYVVAGDLIGSSASESLSVLGDIPNLAARLQSEADPNRMVVSEGTHRLLENIFIFELRGEKTLKGISKPVTIWQVVGENSAYKTSGFVASLDLTELIGRAEIMSVFSNCWDRACKGEAEVVLLASDPGVGKSRILHEFYDTLKGTELSIAFWFCSSFDSSSPFHPVIQFLEKLAGMETNDDITTRTDKLHQCLTELEITDNESITLALEFLGIPPGPHYKPLAISSQKKRGRTFELILGILKQLSVEKPLFVAVEDVQWADPSTLELLDQMISRFRDQRILLIISYRSEFIPPWAGQSNISQYTLNHFNREESTKMVAAVADYHELPAKLLDMILERTDGIPLFIEELTKSILDLNLLERDGNRYIANKQFNSLTIPESLHDSLLARLDTLGTAKELAQIGAVYGRQFPHELIAKITSLHRTSFEDSMTMLESSGLVSRHGFGEDAVYEFKSGLIRDAAYQSLLQKHKQELHAAIAKALESNFSGLWEGQSEIIARHFSKALLHGKAVAYWQQAAEKALAHSAYHETIAHVEEGLQNAEELSDEDKHKKAELGLQLTLGPALMTIHGFASPGVNDAYTRATELAKSLGDHARLFTATWGKWLAQQQAGNMQIAQVLADEVLSLAEELDELEFRLQAHHAIWTTAYRQGNFVKCLKHAKQGVELFVPEIHGSQSSSYGGHDAGTCANNHAALSSWFLGENKRAEIFIDGAIKISDELAQPFSQALARLFAAQLYRYMDNPEMVTHFADAALVITRENGFGQLSAQAELLRGWAVALQSNAKEGIKVMEHALEKFVATGAGGRRGSFLPILADIQIRQSDFTSALKTLENAHAISTDSGERTTESEILYLTGLALYKCGAEKRKIKQTLNKAHEISQADGAKVIEERVLALTEMV